MVTETFNRVPAERLHDQVRLVKHCTGFYDTILEIVRTPWGNIAVCTGAHAAGNLSDTENAERAAAIVYSLDGYGHRTLEEAALHLMAMACGAEINEARQFATFAYRMRPWG